MARKWAKLNRPRAHRKAMLRNLTTQLIKHERIMTTVARAKELRKWAEWMVTLAKQKDDHHKRQAAAWVTETPMIEKLFGILGPRYEARDGGYTRVMKLMMPRRGDSSDMALIEFIDREGELRKAKPPKGGYFMSLVRGLHIADPDLLEAYKQGSIPPSVQEATDKISLETFIAGIEGGDAAAKAIAVPKQAPKPKPQGWLPKRGNNKQR